ncbi:uncharacterized protein MYCGRDRAFT_98639 [Zymoseptoria tritici IPO323]|uniref:F-box domain-containing protein n=1 Tax=Zymoseptoria tritici (strain CBS 115943 / IPO323) TaxID=336722 RepID=F9X153_ZYMTI|nr:uncharacterized protein MYCGRDRAFT_98639 [Zymoseptoria tritici IPO323]EGP91434.1 hypothetical protein MYCGRDRAFT_98639 [Zymoseptoria tritici IPO323]
MAISTLMDLPSELIQHILAYLEPVDLANVAQTCRHLQIESYDNQIWLRLINRYLPTPISRLGPMKSFRELYIAHHPHWFLPQNRIWFGDTEPSGKLLVTRYDEDNGSINAYTVVARTPRGLPTDWELDPDVQIHTFNPKVWLDLNQPVVKLQVDSRRAERPPNDYPSDRSYASESVYTTAITEGTSVWPPLKYPAHGRTRNDSHNRFNSTGHKPTRHDEVSQTNFRLRKWSTFGADLPFFAAGPNLHAGGGVRIRMPEDITTYATLPEGSFAPTTQKPWQGIWVGDYSAHGCEFLVIHQPDKQDERPLPSGMDRLRHWLYGDRRGSDRHFTPSGRLEAMKLTGDPYMPRGEYTFIAPEIGDAGLVRIAEEEPFKGARVVKSAGHIANRGFRDDSYMACQLILISPNRIAQLWQEIGHFGHISFFHRVDIDTLARDGMVQTGTAASSATVPESSAASIDVQL